jgi:hypothetical protein
VAGSKPAAIVTQENIIPAVSIITVTPEKVGG